MGLGMSIELELRHPYDEANAMKIACKIMPSPPQEVVELLGVGGVTQRTMRKLNRGRNRIISDVRQHGCLANLCNQKIKCVWNGCVQLTIEHVGIGNG
jgi:hypothetical protein